MLSVSFSNEILPSWSFSSLVLSSSCVSSLISSSWMSFPPKSSLFFFVYFAEADPSGKKKNILPLEKNFWKRHSEKKNLRPTRAPARVPPAWIGVSWRVVWWRSGGGRPGGRWEWSGWERKFRAFFPTLFLFLSFPISEVFRGIAVVSSRLHH